MPVRSEVDRVLASVAGRQHGTFSLGQVRAAGGDDALARRRVAAGRWWQVDRGVFAFPGHPGTWEQRAMASTLGHPRAVLSGRAAAALWGLEGAGRGRPEVTVPRSTHHRSAIATVRRSDVVARRIRDGIAVNSVPLVLVQLADGHPASDGLFEDGLVKGLTDVGLLRDAHSRWAPRGVPGTAALGRFLLGQVDGAPIPESELELAGERLLDHPDIPAFVRQAPFPGATGARNRVDFLVPAWTTIVEMDGRLWHARLRAQDADRARDLPAAAHGYLTIRLGHASVTRDLVATRAELIAAGRARAGCWPDPVVRAVRDGVDPADLAAGRSGGGRYHPRPMAKPPVLTPQADDFPQWYQDVLNKAELADNGPVRGTMVIRPYGYALWERMQAEVDARIKRAGARNAYFPLFIPESFLKKEAEHVEGFSPELAVVTIGGGKELEEPAVVRPTSETIINHYFSKWVQSHRDLPLLVNQWANVVRWELRPRVFLRTTEFLWQEGHTCHATRDDARDYARDILHQVYEEFMVDVLAIPVVVGRKTARERFAGAINTMTCEAMTGDGKALQMGTSHELGQNFAHAFETRFLDAEGQLQHVWQTSWGVSTRMVGGLIMVHGDDRGLRVPPRLAATQAVVLAVRDDGEVVSRCRALADELAAAGVGVELDDRTETSLGRRATDWELKGVPVRFELGPRDLAEGVAVVVHRVGGEKETVPLDGVVAAVSSALEAAQATLLEEATARREARTVDVATIADAAEAAASGWARIPWATLGVEGEAELAGKGITVRCLVRPDGGVPDDGDEPDLVAIVARSY